MDEYFVVIKEYANGDLRVLGSFEGRWGEDKIELLNEFKRNIQKGYFWIIEVIRDHWWALRYKGFPNSAYEHDKIVSEWEVETLNKLASMAKSSNPLKEVEK